MSHLHPLFVFLATALVIIASSVLGRLRSQEPCSGRYGSIDGLRGYLAFFVFLHHAGIWFVFISTGEWTAGQSNLFTHLGEASVALFFMITGFLFYGKILDNKTQEEDWLKFFVSRIFRMIPLYFFVIGLMLILALIESDFHQLDSVRSVFSNIMLWLLFTVFGEPLINTVYTARFIAGVNWSLPYEWYFYLSMPLLAVINRIRVPWHYMLLSITILSYAATSGAKLFYLVVFGCGIASALVVRSKDFCAFSRRPEVSALVVICLILLVIGFSTAQGYPQLVLLAIVFSLIAGGATLFGALLSKPSRILGEMSYSIYLLHGILLFVSLKYIVGFEAVRNMSSFEYWAVIFFLIPHLVLISAMTYRLIEFPAMQQVPRVMRLLRIRPVKAADESLEDLSVASTNIPQ